MKSNEWFCEDLLFAACHIILSAHVLALARKRDAAAQTSVVPLPRLRYGYVCYSHSSHSLFTIAHCRGFRSFQLVHAIVFGDHRALPKKITRIEVGEDGVTVERAEREIDCSVNKRAFGCDHLKGGMVMSTER